MSQSLGVVLSAAPTKRNAAGHNANTSPLEQEETGGTYGAGVPRELHSPATPSRMMGGDPARLEAAEQPLLDVEQGGDRRGALGAGGGRLCREVPHQHAAGTRTAVSPKRTGKALSGDQNTVAQCSNRNRMWSMADFGRQG